MSDRFRYAVETSPNNKKWSVKGRYLLHEDAAARMEEIETAQPALWVRVRRLVSKTGEAC